MVSRRRDDVVRLVVVRLNGKCMGKRMEGSVGWLRGGVIC